MGHVVESEPKVQMGLGTTVSCTYLMDAFTQPLTKVI